MKFFMRLGLLVFIVYAFSACEQSDQPVAEIEVQRYQANSYGSNNHTYNELIKYSYTYEGYDFYYIYLGELKNIPIFYQSPREHTGLTTSITFSTINITETIIENSVTNSRETTLSTINEISRTKGLSWSLSEEITAKYSAKIFGIGTSGEIKLGAEQQWDDYTTNTTSTTFQQTTSIADTYTVSKKTVHETMESDTLFLDKDYKNGFYRYTMFISSDVYLFVMKDSSTGEIFYEFKEHIIPDSEYWRWDFSETILFKKVDTSVFELDLTILDNLPKPDFDLIKIKQDNGTEASTGSDTISPGDGGTEPTTGGLESGGNTISPGDGGIKPESGGLDL